MCRLHYAAIAFACVSGLSTLPAARACGPVGLGRYAADVLSDDSARAEAAIAKLRAVGPAGLQSLVEAHRLLIDRAIIDPPDVASDPKWQLLRAAIDAVAGQRDAHVSKLYWYTDIELAKDAARREDKPIISLRLLGKLTDELSCANSRYFRTVLYANEEVSRALRDRYVLHWESVRPVPKVTIDFGDGRTLVRTVTGNSIHYMLDAQGRPVDALPGLYGPNAFLAGLTRAAQLVGRLESVDAGSRGVILAEYHQDRIVALASEWKDDLARLGISADDRTASNQPCRRALAVAANKIATAKGAFEGALVAAALADVCRMESVTDDEVWERLGQLHADDSVLDAASVRLIRAQHPPAADAGRLAVSKMVVEDPLLRLVASFQRSVAVDTVRNEYTLHRQIHQWFAGGEFSGDLDAGPLNERVYAELFLTPSSDPWLGLVPGDVYTALDGNGICH